MFNQRTRNGSFDTWVPPKDWSNNDGIQFRLIDSGESPESGVQSPPLWKNSPPSSPATRIQAIVKGQKELMDMVKKMPESCYELTLKDLVEQQTKLGNSQEQYLLQEMDSTIMKEEKKIEGRNGGILENKGLLIKMVFPIGMTSSSSSSSSRKKKKLLKSSSSSSAKISPKPDGCDNKISRNGDKYWLRNMFSSGSDCSRSNSHSSSNKRTRRGFFFFFFSCKGCFNVQKNDSKANCC